MALTLVPLCSTPKMATRNGMAGENAGFLLPFSTYGYWYADGAQLTFPNSEVAQNPSLSGLAPYKELPFNKAAGVCIVDPITTI